MNANTNIFRFKEFEIRQELSAMKIGTDGVLLGAWTPLDHQPDTVLDVGTGTGLVALMLAQRSPANTIDAVEVDDAAYEEAVNNFEASPWGDRLFCYHADFATFAEEMDEEYDLITCNPPYFESQSSEGGGDRLQDPARRRARFESSLPPDILLQGISRLLSPSGLATLVIPFRDKERWVRLAVEQGLYLGKGLLVRGRPGAAVSRYLFTLSRHQAQPQDEELLIETARHDYTEEYRALTRDFYLKM